MTCYAVIDTNVLVSALLTSNNDSATVQVVSKLIEGEIIPVYSNEIKKEYREVLGRRKFGFSADIVSYLLSAMEQYGVFIEPSPSGIILPDMKDLPFYEVVLEKMKESNDAYLVTGNTKHFPVKPFVVTPRELMDILKNAK
ncbi:MAG: putative toxin-antitoxin system toxin component, PIN family [Clostridiales bacterium]|nr:putative toxin-antitoxin system toxin component, PIN family [Clostridiales bacterium]